MLLGVVLLIAVLSVGIDYREPVTFSFSLPLTFTSPTCPPLCPATTTATVQSSSQVVASIQAHVSISVFQEWLVFDKSGRQISSIPMDRKTIGFGILNQVYSATFNKGEVGFVRLNEHHVLNNAVPKMFWGGFVFTTHTIGSLLVNGQRYAGITLIPWPTPSGWSELVDSFIAPNLNGEDAAFFPGDLPGTSRDGAFYIIFNHASTPSACTQHPESCVDITSVVSSGQDVTVSAEFQETWTEWSVTFNPGNVVLGPCDYRVPIDIPFWGLYAYCIHNEEQLGPTPIAMKPILLSALRSMTASTFATNTVVFTTVTTESKTLTKWSVLYSNTTTGGTVSQSPPNAPTFCTLNPDNPLCIYWVPLWDWLNQSTLGIPNLIWVVGGIIVLAAIIWYRGTPAVRIVTPRFE